MEQSLHVGKRTRSILVIEEEYQLRVNLLKELSDANWKVLFAMTEEAIAEAIQTVAGVIFSWDGAGALNRDQVLKMVGDLPLIVAKKPYLATEMVKSAGEKISKDQFFVGDRVLSKITPDWGEGFVVSIYPDQYYGVIFREEQKMNTPEVALRCHFSGLRRARES